MLRKPSTILLILAAWLLGPRSVGASPLLEQLGGFGDTAGLQGRHLATGASAAYFNPALLGDAPAGVMFGLVVLGSRIGISLAEREGASFDVPTGLQNAAHADGTRFDHYPIATETLEYGREASPSQSATSARPRQAQGSGSETRSYTAFGIIVHLFDERLSFGLCGLIPNGSVMTFRSFYVDEREQFISNSLHPEMYGDRMTSLGFGVGLGYRLHKTFSLGLGSAIVIRADARSPAYVADAGSLDGLLLNIDVKAIAGLAPHGGFLWRPIPRLRITGTVHSPQEFPINSDVAFLLSTGVEQTSTIKLLFDWMPWQAGFGASWDVLERKDTVLSVAGSALYGRWSQYVDRHAERPSSDFAWHDTVTGVLGARLKTDKWRYGMDLQYKPTPVPLQQGRSNYVDNDRIGTSQNLEYNFKIGDTKLTIGAQLQGFWLMDRFAAKQLPPTFSDGVNRAPSLVKDEVPDDALLGGRPVSGAAGLQTNNPGWPGFGSKGWLLSGGLYVSLAL